MCKYSYYYIYRVKVSILGTVFVSDKLLGNLVAALMILVVSYSIINIQQYWVRYLTSMSSYDFVLAKLGTHTVPFIPIINIIKYGVLLTDCLTFAFALCPEDHLEVVTTLEY